MNTNKCEHFIPPFFPHKKRKKLFQILCQKKKILAFVISIPSKQRLVCHRMPYRCFYSLEARNILKNMNTFIFLPKFKKSRDMVELSLKVLSHLRKSGSTYNYRSSKDKRR